MFREPVLDFVLEIDREYVDSHMDAYTNAAHHKIRTGSLFLFVFTVILGIVCYKLSIKAQTRPNAISKVVGFLLQGIIIAIAIAGIGALIIASTVPQRLF